MAHRVVVEVVEVELSRRLMVEQVVQAAVVK